VTCFDDGTTPGPNPEILPIPMVSLPPIPPLPGSAFALSTPVDYFACMASSGSASKGDVAANSGTASSLVADDQAKAAAAAISSERGSAFLDPLTRPGIQTLTGNAFRGAQGIYMYGFMTTGWIVGGASTAFDAYSAISDLKNGNNFSGYLNSVSAGAGFALVFNLAAPEGAVPALLAAKATPCLLKDAACRAAAGIPQPFTPIQ